MISMIDCGLLIGALIVAAIWLLVTDPWLKITGAHAQALQSAAAKLQQQPYSAVAAAQSYALMSRQPPPPDGWDELENVR